MVVMIEDSKKHRCRRNGCIFETDNFEEFQRHQREHEAYRRNLYGK